MDGGALKGVGGAPPPTSCCTPRQGGIALRSGGLGADASGSATGVAPLGPTFHGSGGDAFPGPALDAGVSVDDDAAAGASGGAALAVKAVLGQLAFMAHRLAPIWISIK